MSNYNIKVRMEVTCFKCQKTSPTVGDISAYIEEGGRIDMRYEPEYPAGWVKHRWKGTFCHECAAEADE